MLTMVFPFDISDQINSSFWRQVQYQEWTGRWIVWDNDRAKAEQLKQMYPTAYVYLYDREHDTYTRYTIDLLIPKQTMHNGRFVEQFEKQTV
jgi:hypothetical protein